MTEHIDENSNLIAGTSGAWEVVIGLEVHAQVVSEAKLFSGAATKFGSAPNSQVSLVDAAMPGMLPVINMECVRQAVRTGFGLNAQINPISVFDRKNYFYPDLPQGYQISQFKQPVVGEGRVAIELSDGTIREIGIERLHLEQDAGKSVHDEQPEKSYIDLNRSGVALMEIVSKPDMRSSEEAAAYVAKIRTIVRYLGTCDGNMDEGSLRADVNVSVRRPGEDLGTRCEIKNVNSIRFVREAADYEARRQIDVLEGGGTIDQETRLFDPDRGETRPMRSKEEAHDYRYFPDPDLLPLELELADIAAIQAALPELPDARRARLVTEFELSDYDSRLLTAERETADYFEAVISASSGTFSPKLAANWIVSELFARLNAADVSIADSPIGAEKLTGLLKLVADDTISGRTAKDVFDEMYDTGANADDIVERKGLRQITDTSEIETIVSKIAAANTEQVAQYQAGNEKVVGWFVGQVMRETQGKANPKLVNEILHKLLKI